MSEERLTRAWNGTLVISQVDNTSLILSGLNLPLSSSSTTSRELLSQFSTCSGWRWFDVVKKLQKIFMYLVVLVNQFHGNFHSKTICCRKIKFVFRDVKWCFIASWGLKGLIPAAVADTAEPLTQKQNCRKINKNYQNTDQHLRRKIYYGSASNTIVWHTN